MKKPLTTAGSLEAFSLLTGGGLEIFHDHPLLET